jgi:hypothetical protein
MNPRTAHLKPPANTQSYREESEVDRASAFPFRNHTRRRFLGRLGGLTAAATASGTGGLTALLDTRAAKAAEIGPESPQQRRNRAYQIRHDAALFHKNLPLPDHPTNGDEELYPNRIASYSKALPHNYLGEVDLNAYNSLLRALTSGRSSDFEAIVLGGTVKLVNPQAALAFELEGSDSHHLAMKPPPAFDSAEEAGEIAELYWQALTRDVHYLDYGANPLTQAAASDLSLFSDFRGPKAGGRVTPATLFRGNTPGDVAGPYISQFLWKDVPFGAQTISQRIRTVVPDDDYLVSYNDWLEVQRGAERGSNRFDPVPRYIRNNRDMAEWVHVDVLFQAYFNAMLILFGMEAPFDARNPYANSRTQIGFGTFGGPHIASLVCAVATCALKSVWYQKWSVHRRLRPEAFGGRIHNHVTRAATYPIHPDILNSAALVAVFGKNGTYLLPQAFPEGSPTHPAYGAGHATVAGACVTILKAWFDESFVIPNPVVPTADGLGLVPYSGPSLTVGGELNKLAANVAMGRNAAGIHWRSDYAESLKLGEAVAINILTDHSAVFNEQFGGFSLTRFDGITITG